MDRIAKTQLISSAVVHESLGKPEQKLLELVSKTKSRIPGYVLELENFGSEEIKSVFSRNYSLLFKARGYGLKAYMRTKDEIYEKNNLYRQLAKFDGRKEA